MLYPLSYEGGAWPGPSLEASLHEALSGRPSGTGYWTPASWWRRPAAETTRTIIGVVGRTRPGTKPAQHPPGVFTPGGCS